MKSFVIDDAKINRELADARSNTRYLPMYGNGGMFLDLGANIGEVSMCAARQFDKVVGIEAHPQTFQRAHGRTATIKNITLLNAVVAAEDGEDFYVSTPENSTGATARKSMRLNDDNYYAKVKSISINTLLRKWKPRVIKMDIEGSEYGVIAAMKPNKQLEWMSIEFHGVRSKVGTAKFHCAEAVLINHGFRRELPKHISMNENGIIKAFYFVAVYRRCSI